MTITEFCEKHDACENGHEWAISTGLTTMAELWLRDMRPEWREWIATRPGILDDRELRLYACWCVRQMWSLLPDERSKYAVEVAERFADGTATAEELASASASANDAASSAWAVARAANAACCASDARAALAAWASSAACAACAAIPTGRSAWHACAAIPAGRSAWVARASYLLSNVSPDFDNKEGGL